MALFDYTPPAYSGIHSLLDPEAEAKFRASFTFPQSLFDLSPSSDAIEPVIQVASAANNALLPLRRRRRLPVDEGGGDDNSNDPPPKSLIRPYQVGMDYGFGGPPEIDPDIVYDEHGTRYWSGLDNVSAGDPTPKVENSQGSKVAAPSSSRKTSVSEAATSKRSPKQLTPLRPNWNTWPSGDPIQPWEDDPLLQYFEDPNVSPRVHVDARTSKSLAVNTELDNMALQKGMGRADDIYNMYRTGTSRQQDRAGGRIAQAIHNVEVREQALKDKQSQPGKALSDAEFFRLLEPAVNKSPSPPAPPLPLSNKTVFHGEELSEEEQRRLEENEAVLPAPFTYPPTGGLLGQVGNYLGDRLSNYANQVSDIGRMKPWAGLSTALMPLLTAAFPTPLSLPFSLLSQYGEDSTPYEYTGKPVTDIMYGPNKMKWFGADVPGGGYYNRVENGLLGPAGSQLTVHGPETKPGWFLGGDRQLIPATVRGAEDQIIDGRLVRGAGPDMAGRTFQYDFHGDDHPDVGFAVGEDLPAQMEDLESLMNVDYEQGLWDDAY